MRDITKLSDEELLALTKPDIKTISNEELLALAGGRGESQGQAALESAANAATMGYLPQVQAAVGELVEKIPQPINTALEKAGFTIQEQPRGYIERRDLNIQRQQRQREQYPVTTTAAELGGGLASMVAPGFGATKAVKPLAKILESGVRGGVQAALYSPEVEQGQEQGLQLGERFEQAKRGAAFGGSLAALGRAGEKAVKSIKSAPDKLSRSAERQAFRALNTLVKKEELAQDRGILNRVGRKLIDNKIVQTNDAPKDVVKKLDPFIDDVGAKIKDIYKNSEAQALQSMSSGLNPRQAKLLSDTALKPKNIVARIENGLRKKYKNSSFDPFRGELKSRLENISSIQDDLSASDLIGIRSELDKLVRWSKRAETNDAQDAIRFVRNEINDIVDQRLDALDRITGLKNSSEIKKLRQDFSDMMFVREVAEKKAAHIAKNQNVSLGDKAAATVGGLLGLAGGSAGAIAGAAGLAIANKYARERGGTTLAVLTDKVARSFTKQPKGFGKYSTPLFEALQESPEKFVRVIESFSSEPEFKGKVRRYRD